MKKKVASLIATAVTASLAPMLMTPPSSPNPAPQHAAPYEIETSTAVPWGSTWNYYHALADLPGGPDFARIEYDSSGWETGIAPFGWGNVEIATRLDNTDPPITTNYRKTFAIENLEAVTAASITVIANDGVVVYLNGVEVGRINMAAGVVDRNTYAHSAYSVTETLTIPTELLVNGQNVVAVEGHLNYRKSPTVQFDARVEVQQMNPAPAPQPDPDPADLPDWGLPVWADEFDGPLDPLQWRVRDLDYMSYDQAFILADNVTTRDGNLVISTRKLDTPVVKSDGVQRWWSTGYVDTIPTFHQQYGRWEMRAKLPLVEGNSAGIWPAIWLRDAQGRGEIDIMEAIGSPHSRHSVSPDGTWSQTIHQSTGHESGTVRINQSHYPTEQDPYIWDDWHTWALEWTPEQLTFFFDDEVSWEVSYQDHPWLATAFTEAGVNIRINTQVGSSWAGWVDPHADNQHLPAEFLIDYVRVWELPMN